MAAGRRYVQAYVDFIHYVEKLHELLQEGSEESAHAMAAPPHTLATEHHPHPSS